MGIREDTQNTRDCKPKKRLSIALDVLGQTRLTPPCLNFVRMAQKRSLTRRQIKESRHSSCRNIVCRNWPKKAIIGSTNVDASRAHDSPDREPTTMNRSVGKTPLILLPTLFGKPMSRIGLFFYTSGRTSNEAAFLYQLFAQTLGTNNMPDCSNMCHESSGRGLGEAIGIGKGTVSLKTLIPQI